MYSKLGTKHHVSLIQEDIVLCEHTLNVRHGICKLSSQLKMNDVQIQRKHLIHTTCNKYLDKNLFNTKACLLLNQSTGIYVLH